MNDDHSCGLVDVDDVHVNRLVVFVCYFRLLTKETKENGISSSRHVDDDDDDDDDYDDDDEKKSPVMKCSNRNGIVDVASWPIPLDLDCPVEMLYVHWQRWRMRMAAVRDRRHKNDENSDLNVDRWCVDRTLNRGGLIG